MFQPSNRTDVSIREKLRGLEELKAEVSSCSKCSLCKQRKTAFSGRFTEPSDVLVVDFSPQKTEDDGGDIMSPRRILGLNKMFSEVSPSMDIRKMSFTTVYKCHGEQPNNDECLKYLNRQIEMLDPVLIVTFGKQALDAISGQSLQLGVPYVAGGKSQFLLFGIMSPKEAHLGKEKTMPTFKSHLEGLAKLAAKYDLGIFQD